MNWGCNVRALVIAFAIAVTAFGFNDQKSSPMASQTRGLTRAQLSSLDAWEPGSVKRIIPGSRGTHMSVEQIGAFSALVELPRRSYVTIFRDPANGMAVATRGGQYFYVWDGDDLLACATEGFFSWSRSYRTAKAPAGNLQQLITWFVTGVDDGRLEQINRSVSRIDLRHAAPLPFFTAESAGGSFPGDPTLDDLDLTNGILRLDLSSPKRRYRASFWMNLAENRLLRSVVDGKETNLHVW
jgi:hypothetical protein